MKQLRGSLAALSVLAASLLLFSTIACKSNEGEASSVDTPAPISDAEPEQPSETPDTDRQDPAPMASLDEAEPEESGEEHSEDASTDSDSSSEASRQDTEEPAETHAAATGSNGCEEGAVSCDETCVDLNESKEHCGKCGRRCFPRQDCYEGSCRGLGIVNVADLQQRLNEKDFLLINVRVPAAGVIPGTDASIPHDRFEELKAAIGDDLDSRIVLYCGTSNRVQTPLRNLIQGGYRSVTYVDGGITAWRMAGLPLLPN